MGTILVLRVAVILSSHAIFFLLFLLLTERNHERKHFQHHTNHETISIMFAVSNNYEYVRVNAFFVLENVAIFFIIIFSR